jgi:uncharacterized protein YhaN
MTQSKLSVESISITRMPGIRSPGFNLDHIDPQITILVGPNGIGKSTTATALRGLLWPDIADPAAIVTGQLNVDGSLYELELNTNRVQVHSLTSNAGTFATLPSSNVANRYYLALQDLIRSTDTDFAQIVKQEAAGGYDIEAARSSLKYKPDMTRPTGKTKALNDARSACDRASDEQEKLLRRENALKQQRIELAKLKSLADEIEYLTLAKEYFDLQDNRRHLLLKLRSFSVRARLLSGNEAETVLSFDQKVIELKNELFSALNDRRAAWRTIKSAGFVNEAPSELLILQLRELAQGIAAAEATVSGSRVALAGATSAELEAVKQLDKSVSPDQVSAIDDGEVDNIAELCREADRLALRKLQYDEAKRMWGGVQRPSNLDQIKILEDRLCAWLSAPDLSSKSTTSWHQPILSVILLSAVAIAALCVLTVTSSHWWIILFAVVALAIVIAIRGLRKADNTAPDIRKTIEREIQFPAGSAAMDFTESAVKQRLAEVRMAIHSGMLDNEKCDRWNAMSGAIGEFETDLERVKTSVTQLCDRLGFGLGSEPNPVPRLFIFASSLNVCRKAAISRSKAAAELEEAKLQLIQKTADYNALITPYSSTAIEEHNEARALADDLDSRRTKWVAASQNLANSTLKSRKLIQDIKRQSKQSLDVFKKLKLNNGDLDSLKNLILQHVEFEEALNKYSKAKWSIKPNQSKLKQLRPELLSCAKHVLEDKIDKAGQAKFDAEALHARILETEAEVNSVKKATQLEERLATYQNALTTLEEARDAEYSPVVGNILSNFVAEESRQQDRPDVFKRANEIFKSFTNGAFRLELDDKNPPAFCAFDAVNHSRHSLDELSSGTRIQVLISVRLAFIETLEGNVKLPLIIDEALANSDDGRTREVLAALFKLCRSGRQLIYLTARHDEAEKLKEKVDEEPDMTCSVIDLAKVRGLQNSEHRPRKSVPALQEVVIEPNGSHISEYSRLINAPCYDPNLGIGSVDICDLADDAQTVYNLRTRGISCLGQFSMLRNILPESIVGNVEAQRMAAKARVLEAIGNDWKASHPPRVSFDEIKASGAVSDKFEDAVRNLVTSVNGDAKVLIDQLRGSAITGFRANKTEDLRNWLLERGYIVEVPPLGPDRIFERAIQTAGPDIRTDILTLIDVKALVSLLPEEAEP